MRIARYLTTQRHPAFKEEAEFLSRLNEVIESKNKEKLYDFFEKNVFITPPTLKDTTFRIEFDYPCVIIHDKKGVRTEIFDCNNWFPLRQGLEEWGKQKIEMFYPEYKVKKIRFEGHLYHVDINGQVVEPAKPPRIQRNKIKFEYLLEREEKSEPAEIK